MAYDMHVSFCSANGSRTSTCLDFLVYGTSFDYQLDSDAEIRANVYKSLLLNSLSLLSIYVFDLLLQPLVKDQQKWFHRNIGWFYQILWLLPVVGVSLYLNVRSIVFIRILSSSTTNPGLCPILREHGAQ